MQKESASKELFFQEIKNRIGPGVITGVADDDPSGIGTYSQTGAMFGYGQLWLALYSFPFMYVVQEMCGRLGLVTRKGLGTLIREHYSRKVLAVAVILLAVANIVNIGADLGIMAEAFGLITPVPFMTALIAITFISLYLEVFVPYPKYVNFLKWMALTVFSYVIAAFCLTHDWGKITISLFVPHIEWNQAFLMNIVAMLGTTISPYLFFWQTDEEVEELKSEDLRLHTKKGHRRIDGAKLANMRHDTLLGMFVSNAITFFIIITASQTLHSQGIFTIDSISQMADSLKPLAGDYAYLLFTAGIIGTGLLAVPILAGSAAYAVTEAIGREGSLSDTFTHARVFYGVIITATGVGLMVNMLGIPSVSLLYIAAIVNGLLAPPLLFLIIGLSNKPEVLGGRTNGRFTNTLGYAIALFMSACALGLIYSLLM